MLEPGPNVGLVLSGGGARGAFQVGVWEILRDDPRGLGGPPAVVSGTSAGAINGALIAAGLSPARMLEFWLDLAERPPVVANRGFFRSVQHTLARLALREPARGLGRRARSARLFGRLLVKHRPVTPTRAIAAALEFVLTARFDTVSALLDGIQSAHLFSLDPFKQRLAEVLGGTVVPPGPVRLAVNAIDITTGSVVRFVDVPPDVDRPTSAAHYRHVDAITVDMVASSAAIPLLFSPVRHGDHLLWDGGLLVNTPIAPAVALGARCIIPVLVTAGASGANGSPLTFGAAIERLADAFLENAYNTDRVLLLERNRLAAALPDRGFEQVCLYEPIRPASGRTFNAGSYLYFEKDALLRMYEAGRAAARAWLDHGPPRDLDPDTEDP